MKKISNIAIVTGTRAEYGLLKPLVKVLKKKYKVRLIVTGMHLSPEFGSTVNEMVNDGFQPDEKVEMLLSSDTECGIVKSMGLGMISFADLFQRSAPDILIVLGDRFEIFSVVTAASVMKIPVVHLHGGELTEGAIDDNFRHAITKMSHIHFVSTEVYRERVLQLGEQPDTVFNVGAIGLDNIVNTELPTRDQLSEMLHVDLAKKTLLVTYHPVTLESFPVRNQIDNLLAALESFPDYTMVLTKANADANGRMINETLVSRVGDRKNCHVFDSLGSRNYLGMMKAADAVVGNSSSGIIEAPGLGTPTVNIGNRQKGRVRADSVVDCGYDKESIVKAVELVLSDSFRSGLPSGNPYGNGGTAEAISEILGTLDIDKLIPKHFYDRKYQ